MTRFVARCLPLLLGMAAAAGAQSLDDLNIQIHGFATQGFLYTTQNNILTTTSSDGSPAWTEAVVNVGAQPAAKLRIGVQARYFLLGNYGNAVTLDWAAADYRVNDHFGVRFGKVKTPNGLLNEIADIDPSYLWSLLPQGTYPIGTRNSNLSHLGGVVYGGTSLGAMLGRLEYRGWGGNRTVGSDDGLFVNSAEHGIQFPKGVSGAMTGAALHWLPPVAGLMLGASDTRDTRWVAPVTVNHAVSGNEDFHAFSQPDYFARYEKRKLMLAGEWLRFSTSTTTLLVGYPGLFTREDYRSWYGMASYKFTEKLTAGLYHSQFVDHAAVLGPARYSKDWTASGRYDFTQFLYLKAEEHFIAGTAQDFDLTLNPGGLNPSTRLTILKAGLSF